MLTLWCQWNWIADDYQWMTLLSVKHMTKPESFQFHWVYVSERDMMSLELGWQGVQTNRKLLNRFKCQMRCRVVSYLWIWDIWIQRNLLFIMYRNRIMYSFVSFISFWFPPTATIPSILRHLSIYPLHYY